MVSNFKYSARTHQVQNWEIILGSGLIVEYLSAMVTIADADGKPFDPSQPNLLNSECQNLGTGIS